MKRRLADAKAIHALITKLAAQISRHNPGVKDLALVGIKRRGVPLAERIAARLNSGRRSKIPVGAIDITLYRDDLQMVSETPIVRGTEISFDINGKTLVLVDDVVFTGRTIRAALSALLDFGRPRAIQLAVLVDRGHVVTRSDDLVDIFLKETDGRDEIVLTRRSLKSKVQSPKSP